MSAALFGLVLAGGASTRMQRDKATLAYHGRPQLDWAYQLLSEVCAATFISVRPDQRTETTRAQFPQIVDRQPGTGPIAGISAALQEHPKAAWLIVACDLPFLTRETLQHLIAHRDPQRMATAYRSAHDSLPEPLCAIWEPSAREAVLAYMQPGKQCPRKFLINSNALLLDLPDVRALDNVNTVEEFGAASAALQNSLAGGAAHDLSSSVTPAVTEGDIGTASPALSPLAGESRGDAAAKRPIALRIQYYALLREQAGRSEETLDTSAGTPTELYRELQARHPFRLGPEQLKVAINAEFSDWNTTLRNGDTIVFIPPVAGG